MRRRRNVEPEEGHDPELEAIAFEQAEGLRFLPGRFEWLGIDQLEPHPRNANEGDLGLIHDRVAQLGFYGLIYVQEATWNASGRYTILAGEHRYLTLQARGSRRVPCWVLDVDDDTALRILVGDNHATRAGRDRPDEQAALLAELAATERGLGGTGFDHDDLDMLLADAARASAPFEPPPPPPPESHGRAGVHATCPHCGHRFTLGTNQP